MAVDYGAVGRRLKAAREAKGIAFADACEQLKVGRATLWRIERGDADRAVFGTIARYAELVGDDLADCLPRTPDAEAA